MTSDEARERVLDYAYGEMSADEAARFEALLADDPALQAEVEAVRAVREAASGLAAVPLPVDVRVRLLREAERYARRQARGTPVFWSFLERFLLSPAFTGALVVAVALGVGVHLLFEMGTEDRLSRIERAERAAMSRPEPAEEPAGEPVGPEADKVMQAPPPVATMEAEAGERPATGTTARRARETTRKKVAGVPESRGREVSITLPAVVGARGSGMARDEAPQTTLEGAFATIPAGNGLSGQSEGRAAGAPSAPGAGPREMPPPAAPAAAEAPQPRKAPAKAMAWEAEADRDQAAGDARADLARARQLKARGALEAALTAYRKVLGAGTLTGYDLADALAEAAEVAIALKRPDTARAFLDRLKTLPGGPARAAPLERALERTESR